MRIPDVGTGFAHPPVDVRTRPWCGSGMSDTEGARPVDPRDIRRQIDRPGFRVHLWNAGRTACREWELPGTVGDVREAIAWAAERRAPGETAEVHAVIDAGGPTLVTLARITGEEPGPGGGDMPTGQPY